MSASAVASKERELNSTSLLTAGVVLATVTMTFGAMIAVFVVRSASDVYWGHIQLPGILWLTTAILLASTFTERYFNKGVMRAYLQQVPVRLIEHGQLGVIGAAGWFLDEGHGE